MSILDAESIPSAMDLKKRKRLAAFRMSENAFGLLTKLHPIQLKGKGRVLLDISSEGWSIIKSTPPAKKRGNRRKKAGFTSYLPLLDRVLALQPSEADRPNWPDSEFPWRLRLEECAGVTRAQEKDRLRRIEEFLERDTDEEDDHKEGGALRSMALVQVIEDPMKTGKGRGKMVPLNANSNSPTSPRRRRSIFFPSDPADARAALLSKKYVRALAYRTKRGAKDESTAEESDEVVCICNDGDNGSELVQCDGCTTWYHLQCIGVRNIADLGEEEDPWYCDNCAEFSRMPSLDPALSSEPTFVPTHDEPAVDVPYDLPFFQASLESSPVTAWSSSRPPTTPVQSGGSGSGFSPRYSLYDPSRICPSTPRFSCNVNTPLGTFDNLAGESPFDPTSTPSRGIKFAPQFTTPKNNLWSARGHGLLQTPSKIALGYMNRTLVEDSLSPDETNSSALYSTHRNRLSSAESPIGWRLAELPLASRLAAAPQYLPLQESPMMYPSERQETIASSLQFSRC
jgi:hypothetical protein